MTLEHGAGRADSRLLTMFRLGSLMFVVIAVILVAAGDALARLIGSLILGASLLAVAIAVIRRRA